MIISKSRYEDDLLITDFNNNQIYEKRQPIILEKGDQVIKYEIKEDMNTQDIAKDIYNDSRLWWVVADALNIMNPFDKIELKNKSVILPTFRTVSEKLIG